VALDALELRYFGAGDPANRANSEVKALVDGADYFDAIAAEIAKTGAPGDAIYITGWRARADWDLSTGATVNATDPNSLAMLLATRAAAGVDVRLVFSAHMSRAPGTVPYWGQLHMGQMIQAAIYLRGALPPGASAPPLADRVILDFSGAFLGSHHQKFTAIKAGAETVAFVGGIDYHPLRRDDRNHNTHRWASNSPLPNSPYGWHDAGVEIRGHGVAKVFETFTSRWQEAATLPPRNYSHGTLFNRLPINPAIAPSAPMTPTPNPVPTSSKSVRLVRSRYPYKLPFYTPLGNWTPWTSGQGITEVFATYSAAIAGAQRWIYIEDQYLGDKDLPGFELAPRHSLMPKLLDAARRGVKLIFVGSGKDDGDPPPFHVVNLTYPEAGQVKAKITDVLDADAAAAGTTSKSANVAVWRMDILTVHSKLVLIDDAFAAIGSANLMSRSMYGLDSELQVAVVDDGRWVKDVRKALWAEHLKIGTSGWPSAVDAALEDEAVALGMWRPSWLPSGVPSDTWVASDKPVGFNPTSVARTYVGPP
jgi:phosphatidylserine/phosphatidylglycerophosphate/cardiolipin synthase-like enzyme